MTGGQIWPIFRYIKLDGEGSLARRTPPAAEITNRVLRWRLPVPSAAPRTGHNADLAVTFRNCRINVLQRLVNMIACGEHGVIILDVHQNHGVGTAIGDDRTGPVPSVPREYHSGEALGAGSRPGDRRQCEDPANRMDERAFVTHDRGQP